MNLSSGMFLLIVSALISGNFVLPIKYIKGWNWEVVWLVYSVFSLIVMPWLLTLLVIPNCIAVYTTCSGRAILLATLFGLGWGVAQVLYGVGLAMLGVSLGNALMIGIAATLGSGIPLIVLHPEQIFGSPGLSILLGVAIMLIGIYCCAIAGRAREAQNSNGGEGRSRRFGKALVVCIAAGVLAPLMTLALAFGSPIMDRALALGVSTNSSTYLIWDLVLPLGSIASVIYCLYLMHKNRSLSQLKLDQLPMGVAWKNWLLALIMAGLSYGGVILFGISTLYLGPLGVSVAQALFVIFLILGANIVGTIAGEWRGIRGSAITSLVVGNGLLTLACAVIAIGNR
jgi:L-rhamnose-H+ transport protein